MNNNSKYVAYVWFRAGNLPKVVEKRLITFRMCSIHNREGSQSLQWSSNKVTFEADHYGGLFTRVVLQLRFPHLLLYDAAVKGFTEQEETFPPF